MIAGTASVCAESRLQVQVIRFDFAASFGQLHRHPVSHLEEQ